jgi:hypothetical protein
MASPTYILQNLYFDTTAQENQEIGWQCCGGLNQLGNPYDENAEMANNAVLEAGIFSMKSYPYTRGDALGANACCEQKGWLDDSVQVSLCNTPKAARYMSMLDDESDDESDAGGDRNVRFVVDNFKTIPTPTDIPHALVGAAPYSLQGPGPLCASFFVDKKYFPNFSDPDSKAWLNVDSARWESDHPGTNHLQFTRVYCFPQDERPVVAGGHAVSIVGYLRKVYVPSIQRYVDAYVVRNSWITKIENNASEKIIVGSKPWGDGGLFLWATSISWKPNEQLGMDNNYQQQDVGASSMRVRADASDGVVVYDPPPEYDPPPYGTVQRNCAYVDALKEQLFSKKKSSSNEEEEEEKEKEREKEKAAKAARKAREEAREAAAAREKARKEAREAAARPFDPFDSSFDPFDSSFDPFDSSFDPFDSSFDPFEFF